MTEFDELMHEISRSEYEPISTERDLNVFLLNQQIKYRDNTYRTGMAIWLSARHNNVRAGQAFMNALPDPHYEKLTATAIDPYHKDDMKSVLKALDYLQLSS